MTRGDRFQAHLGHTRLGAGVNPWLEGPSATAVCVGSAWQGSLSRGRPVDAGWWSHRGPPLSRIRARSSHNSPAARRRLSSTVTRRRSVRTAMARASATCGGATNRPTMAGDNPMNPKARSLGSAAGAARKTARASGDAHSERTQRTAFLKAASMSLIVVRMVRPCRLPTLAVTPASASPRERRSK